MKRSLILSAACILLCFGFLPVANAQNCAAPLNGGTVSATATSVCPTSFFGVSVTGSSTGSGLSYQWQSSPDNNSWTDIPGSTLITLTASQDVTTWYRRKIMCSAGGEEYSSSVQITSKDFNTCYCTPSTTNCTSGFSITRVVYSTINNSSACGTNGYANYSGSVAPANVMQGSWLPISVTVASGSTSRYVHCYIDFNQNGNFEPKEHTMLSLPSGNVYSGFIKVPFRAKTGSTRMRVIFHGFSTSTCFPESNSETEDYTINITPNTTSAQGHVIYVKQTAVGSTNSGRDWANARFSMRSALDIAFPGDTIKVAKGIFYNGTVKTNGITLVDSITLLGGYPDSGNPTDAQRNPGTNPTILSGLASAVSTNADYHVLYASGTLNQCVVDGFIIQNGGFQYDGTPSQLKGGGISIENGANIILRNCVFRNNNAYIDAGVAIAVNNARPVFQNCMIIKNGNEVYRSNILIENTSVVQFVNTLVAGNLGSRLMMVDSSKVFWKNSTVAHNLSSQMLIEAVKNSEVHFANSITYFNGIYNATWQNASYDSLEVSLQSSTASFKNGISQVYRNGMNMVAGIPPKFKDTSSIAGPDGFFFTADDGFSLSNPCSPAINAGSNTEAAGITSDITRQTRIFGSVVDIGAYEVQQVQATVPKVIYVNAAATGANDGSNWANAFTDIHKALAACSDTIKIAAGTYSPWKTPTAQPYLFENKRIILGGYPATGNPSNSERNYRLHPTFINGAIDNTNRADIVVRGQNLDSTSVVDGLIFTNVGNDGWAHDWGAVIYSYCNNPVISNCVFTGNFRRVFQGRYNQNPVFVNCEIYGNTPASSNALDLVTLTNSQRTTFKNCVFRNNSLVTSTGISGQYGKIISLDNTHASFDSCTFQRNLATVVAMQYSNPQFSHTQFLQNYARENTADLRNVYSNPVFSNCVFRDSAWNFVYASRGGIMNNFISNPVFTDCQFYNGRVDGYGGVAYNDSSKPRFTNCVFSNNHNAFYDTNGSHMELTNCVATGTVTANFGGGASFMHNIKSSPKLTNCVVVNSKSNVTTGVIFNDATSSPKIYNAVFWRNFQGFSSDVTSLNNRAEIKNAAGAQPDIKNSLFEFLDAGVINKNTKGLDPRFRNFENPIGRDSIWFTADDGLQLCDCSPAINTGENSYVQQATDITNQNRIFGATVDKGAYELQTAPVTVSKTSYVNSTASGNGSGVNWNDAYNSLYPALANPCTDTIKIASGIYKPAVQNRDSSFYLNRNLVIKGSYSVTTDAQDVDVHPTIFSSDIGVPNDTADNSFLLVRAVYIDTLVLDGLVIKGSPRSSHAALQNQAGISATYIQQLTVSNCRIRDNYATSTAGGLMLFNVKQFDIRKTVFSGNRAVWGAGVYVAENGSSKRFTDCVFEKNYSSFQGGGVWVAADNGPWSAQSGVAFTNCIFTGNVAKEGAGMLLSNAPDVKVTNCTFANNLALVGQGVSYGAGIFCAGLSSQGGGIGPLISNSIFTGNRPQTLATQNVYHDIYYPKNGNPPHGGQVELRIHHSAVSTLPVYYWGGGNIDPSTIRYKNENNPVGPDGKWFTGDDGLQLAICSDGTNKGDNASVTVQKDAAGNDRIINATVDMGAYEMNGMPLFAGLLNVSNDSIIANKEITDTLGWTHYYRDCRYLLSIKKNGKIIGTVGDGTFEVKVLTTASYGSGQGMNLTSAAYNVGGLPWYVMNRYWAVKSTATISDSILVRFPYTRTDFEDVKGSNPAVSQHTQLEFFKVSGTNNPFDLSVPVSNFIRYGHGTNPSLKNWTSGQQDSIFYCDYYVPGFSGGGGGARYNGVLPDLVISNSSLSANSVGAGNSFNTTFTESNTSTAGNAAAHKVQFYLSTDNSLSTAANGDVLLGSYDIPSLNASNNTGALSKQLTVPCGTTAGNYYLFIVADGQNSVAEANENNNAVSQAIMITAGGSTPATPVIQASPGATVCAGTPVSLTATSAGCTSCTYSWSNGASGSTITVSSAGTYTVTVSNGCGSATASQVVTVNASPTVTISATQSSICLGNSVTLTASGADAYSWTGAGLAANSGSQVTATPNAAGALQYTVTGTRNECAHTATISITVTAAPVITVSPGDTSICTGSSVALTASGATTYSWSPATGLSATSGASVVASPSASTTYTVTGTRNGCTGTLSRTVSILPQVTPSVTIGYTGCPGNALTFTPTAVNGGTNPQYQWYVNNFLISNGHTFTLNNAANGMNVHVRMTSNAACVSTPTVNSTVTTVNCITTGIPNIDALETFSISPNPTKGLLQANLKLRQAKKVSFEISDSYGKIVYLTSPVLMSGVSSKRIDLTAMAIGTYYLRTTIGNESFVEKVVIAR